MNFIFVFLSYFGFDSSKMYDDKKKIELMDYY